MNPYQINPISSYANAAEEFEARKRARMLEEQLANAKMTMLPIEMQKAQLENQALQKQVEMGIASSDPAAIREWKIYSSLSPENQQRYLQMKRADQIMNLGGQMAVRSPLGGIAETFPVTPKPEQMPSFQAAQTSAKARATEQQAVEKELAEREASLPRLNEVVANLRDLSKAATYSIPKQAFDWAAAQSGFGATEGAKARTQYQSIIDNEILPLLRQTFGAQFTEREGQSLKDTLGDVNKTPEEKQAVLDSFISGKIGQIETLKRQRQSYGEVPQMEEQELYAPVGIKIDTLPPPLTSFEKEEAAFNERKRKKKTIRFEDLPQ